MIPHYLQSTSRMILNQVTFKANLCICSLDRPLESTLGSFQTFLTLTKTTNSYSFESSCLRTKFNLNVDHVLVHLK